MGASSKTACALSAHADTQIHPYNNKMWTLVDPLKTAAARSLIWPKVLISEIDSVAPHTRAHKKYMLDISR